MKPVIVIGHKNPDSDSICSAICYANLKRILTGNDHIPCRAGELNQETAYVLEKFGVETPQLITSLEPRITDVEAKCREVNGQSGALVVEVTYTVRSTNNRYNHVYPFYVTEGSEGGGAG